MQDGNRTLQFCMGHGGLRVANTFFNHTDEETATWISPGALSWRTLDLILLREPAGIRPMTVDCMVLPHATSNPTDHRLVIYKLIYINLASYKLRVDAQPKSKI